MTHEATFNYQPLFNPVTQIDEHLILELVTLLSSSCVPAKQGVDAGSSVMSRCGDTLMNDHIWSEHVSQTCVLHVICNGIYTRSAQAWLTLCQDVCLSATDHNNLSVLIISLIKNTTLVYY